MFWWLRADNEVSILQGERLITAMAHIFRKHGRNPEACFSTLSTSPWVLMELLEAYCSMVVRAHRTGVKAIQPLVGDWDESETLQTRMSGHGALRFGPWRTLGSRLHPDAGIIIHLPTALRHFRELYLRCPPLVFLFGMFLPLVGRRSPLAESILRRDLVYQTHELLVLEAQLSTRMMDTIEELPVRHQVPHPEYPLEEGYYQRVLDFLVTDSAFLSDLRRSIAATFGEWASWGGMKRKLARLHDSSEYQDSTETPYHLSSILFRPGNLRPCEVAPKKVFHIRSLQRSYKSKFRARISGLTEEMLCAQELGTPFENENASDWRRRVMAVGATHYQDKSTNQTFLFVDWERWFKYRLHTTGGFFWPYLVESLVDTLDPLVFKRDDVGAEVQRRILSRYPPGQESILCADNLVFPPEQLLRAWGRTSPREVTLVSGAGLEKASVRNVAKEFGKSPASWASPATRPAAHKPIAFTLSLISSDVTSPEEVVRGECIKRTVYFYISGHYEQAAISVQTGPKGMQEWVYQKGVRKGRFGMQFTADFISANPQLFPRMDVNKCEQLLDFGRQSRREIRRYNRNYGVAHPRGPVTGFTREEDDAIIEFYRPDMTREAELELYQICASRTKRAIQVRAQTLRRVLIDQGVWDIKKLPHRRYNANIGKEIARAKAQRTQKNKT